MNWMKTWQMPFNTAKCKVMHFGNGVYHMCGQILETVNGDRDSGLSCANYCGFKTIIAVPTSIIQEPKKSSVWLEEQFHAGVVMSCSMLRLYRSLVRPYLEFCISAWFPYYQKDKQLSERVQHHFTRMIPGLKQLQWMCCRVPWISKAFGTVRKPIQRNLNS